MKKEKKKKLLFILSFLLFAEIAALSGYEIYTIVAEYKAEERASQQLQQYIDLNAAQSVPSQTEAQAATEPGPGDVTVPEGTENASEPAAEPATEPATEPVQYPAVDFESLLEINEDVVGWIYIEDTRINYPIVQGNDNRHYVSTMVDGSDNAAGSIFMDYRNAPDFADRHTVIYGHNMRNGSMFADILEYQDPEFFAAHPIGMVMTPEGNFRFEVIAGCVAHLEDSSWQLDFAGEDDFGSWLSQTMAMSTIGGSGTADAQDRIITLSTCSYEFSDARFVLVCRIIE